MSKQCSRPRSENQLPDLSRRREAVLTRAAGHPAHADPPEHEHGRVVVDVQERDLARLLPQHEEQRVGKLHQLGDVVEPERARDLASRVRVREWRVEREGSQAGNTLYAFIL